MYRRVVSKIHYNTINCIVNDGNDYIRIIVK